MDKEAELSAAIYNTIKKVTRASVIADAIVIAVDEVSFTCDVTVNNSTGDTPVTFFSVPLRVLVSAQASIVEIPKIDTKCLICFRDGNINRPQILSVHEALKILVICDQIVFNNGTLGGMVKVNDLVSKLNTIENDINVLKAAFSSWTVAPNDGGGALKSAAAAWYNVQLQPTQVSNLENTKIKQ